MDVRDYARLCAELASAKEPREDTLARHGFDESSWTAHDDLWQARLSEAMDIDDDGRVPELLSAFTRAYGEAQSALATPLTLEQFARVTRLVSTLELHAALARERVSLTDYVQASATWNRRIVTDPELARRFEAALKGTDPGST